MESGLYVGRVRHERSAPIPYAFDFPLFMVYADLDELPERTGWRRLFFSAQGPAIAWFRRKDHLGNPDVPLDEAVRTRVEEALGFRPAGPIRVLTHLRYWGIGFNPVTFYYCFGGRGNLQAVVAHITNTPWGERHSYVIDLRDGVFEHDKAFHVSPFNGMKQRYRWRFRSPGAWLHVGVEVLEDDAPPFRATLRMKRRPIGVRSLAALGLRFPLMTLQVLAGIYWHALLILEDGADFYEHPARERKAA